jgi:hypothetical protein
MSSRDPAITLAREADPTPREADRPGLPDPDAPPAPSAGAAPRDPALPPADQGLRALGRSALAAAGEHEHPGSSAAAGERPSPSAEPAREAEARDERPAFDLGRVAWLVTVLACLLTSTILVLDDYIGYAGVTLAVALAAAINLL